MATAGQDDLQQLLRMLTARRVPMLAAMGHARALQAEGLRSIGDVAAAPLAAVERAVGDAKLAKSLHAACRSHGSRAANKRAADDAARPPDGKRARLEAHRHQLDYASMAPDELESSLQLPLTDDEGLIRQTVLVTNRAPLLLAFAVELLRFTMPEQPPSSRLSLAQAVVSANSRAKAGSLGLEAGPARAEDQLPEGQPRVRVLGREVAVLKRGGYSWAAAAGAEARGTGVETPPHEDKTWTASQRVTSKGSTFVAHAAVVSRATQRAALMAELMAAKPELETATHNAWAVRARYGSSGLVQEASFDDGETGCGRYLLQTMRELGVDDGAVVLTRWFGGVMLGAERWRLMRRCAEDALSTQRRTATLAGEAVWALDARGGGAAAAAMAVHRPEAARDYLLRSFVTAGGEATTATAAGDAQRHENLGRLLGALRLLFASWAGALGAHELDRRAWAWYAAVRPDVEAGPAAWGARRALRLDGILALRRGGGEGSEAAGLRPERR